MDFSAFNIKSASSLNLAARNNDVYKVKRLLKKCNPSNIDNRGWTCLHEAAANDSYQSLLLILKHRDCRPLAESFEGHTAFYLACRQKCSMKTIKLLLDRISNIANYCSTEMVSPLHLACAQGRVELVEMLIHYGAILDVRDFDGDTPLHNAVLKMNHEAAVTLLYAGAEPNVKNGIYTPFHIACSEGSLETVKELHNFICDINHTTEHGDSGLMLAAQNGRMEVINYLLQNGADPNITNSEYSSALDIALIRGNSEAFKLLFEVTDREHISEDIVVEACQPHYFNMDIILTLLESDLGPEFFNRTMEWSVRLESLCSEWQCYEYTAPLNIFIRITEYIYTQSKELFTTIFYLFLMKGVPVDAVYVSECPPIVFLYYCPHKHCFQEVLKILLEQGCNMDYIPIVRYNCYPHSIFQVDSSNKYSCPDAFILSLAYGAWSFLSKLPYSLACEPEKLIRLAIHAKVLDRIESTVLADILSVVDDNSERLNANSMLHYIPTLKHSSRLAIRKILRDSGLKTTSDFLRALPLLPLPKSLLLYLRYL